MYAALDEELTRRYQRAYIEKCKRMKAIEMANNESRALQKDIHNLLDVLVEFIDPEELLDSPFWSCSEDDSDDDLFEPNPASHMFLDPSDPECEDDEIDYFSYDMATLSKLKADYAELLEKNERLKKFSGLDEVSGRPSTIPKIRKVHKHLPVNDTGEVEFPVVLGRGMNRISISKIGSVLNIDGLPVPTDYECKRKYADHSGASDRHIHYICSIVANPDPVYRISVDESAESLAEGLSIDEVWGSFTSLFPEAVRAQIDSDFSTPRSFFGLEHDNLMKYFKEQISATQ